MNKKKKISLVLVALALLVIIAMAVHTAYQYGFMLACVEFGGCSAPANVAFFTAIPYAVIVLVLLTIAHILWWSKK